MSPKYSKLSQFWQELKRRKVIYVITVYASAAFVIIELVNNVVEPLNLPERTPTFVILFLAMGFPIAIIMSWIFDMTPKGMEKTKPLTEGQQVESPGIQNRWKIATYVSIAVIIGLIVLNLAGGARQLKAGDIQSLLILPFDNLTGDDQLDYVAAGMHSSLIGDMGQISSLRVISKTSARVYNNVDMSLPRIATEANADAVVEPTVMCYGDSVCILIKVITPFPEEKQLWVAEYKESKSKIMNLYNRVTKQIADEVKVQLTPEEEQLLAVSRTINTEAYDAYLKGLYYWDQNTPEALQLALEYFNNAIEADPGWAEPYAGVAYFWVAIHQFSLAPSSVTIPNMYENLNKAIELDPNSSFVHYVSALVNGWTAWNWEKGEQAFLKVLEMNPNDAFGHMYYAHFLSCLRRIEEAMSHCRIALDLDPLNPMIQALSTMVLANAGEYEEARSMALKAMEVGPNLAGLANLSAIYLFMDEYRKSLELWTTMLQLDDDTRNSILRTFDEKGKVAAVKEFISELQLATGDYFPMELGQLNALAGDESMALYWYEKGYEAHHPMMPYINTVFGYGGPFRIEDPGFDSLLVKMNLPLE
jgi:TolB-like protein/Tfp pilus assembly protein PilF